MEINLKKKAANKKADMELLAIQKEVGKWDKRIAHSLIISGIVFSMYYLGKKIFKY